MRTTLEPAKNLHLDRAARNAGEAFAFDEPENPAPAVRRVGGSGLLWLSVAVLALVGLNFIF